MAVSEEEAKALWLRYDAASRKVKQCLDLKAGGAGAENDLSMNYQALVRAGLAQQIRAKHR